MTSIYSREQVRQAVARALLLCPEAGEDAAIHTAAQSLGLDAETVREVVQATTAESNN